MTRKNKSAGDGIEVVNTSGAPSPNTQAVARSRTADPAPPSEPPGRRTQVVTGSADASQHFSESVRARSRETWGKTLATPGECRLLANLFGLPGHDDCARAAQDPNLRVVKDRDGWAQP